MQISFALVAFLGAFSTIVVAQNVSSEIDILDQATSLLGADITAASEVLPSAVRSWLSEGASIFTQNGFYSSLESLAREADFPTASDAATSVEVVGQASETLSVGASSFSGEVDISTVTAVPTSAVASAVSSILSNSLGVSSVSSPIVANPTLSPTAGAVTSAAIAPSTQPSAARTSLPSSSPTSARSSTSTSNSTSRGNSSSSSGSTSSRPVVAASGADSLHLTRFTACLGFAVSVVLFYSN